MRSEWTFELLRVRTLSLQAHYSLLLVVVWFSIGGFSPQSSDPALNQLSEDSATLITTALLLTLLTREAFQFVTAQLLKLRLVKSIFYPFGAIHSFASPYRPLSQIVFSISGLVGLALPLLAVTLFSNDVQLTLGSVIGASVLDLTPNTFSEALLTSSSILFAVNLLPALPLDGGQIFRAILTLTKTAAPIVWSGRVTQAICLSCAVAAFFYQQPVLFVAAFATFYGALKVYLREQSRALATAFTVHDVMVPYFKLEKISHGTTVSGALKIALTSMQDFYPVVIGNSNSINQTFESPSPKLVGIVLRQMILEHAALHPDGYISELIVKDPPVVAPAASLKEALDLLDTSPSDLLVVKSDSEFLGVVANERVAEFLMMKSFARHSNPEDDITWSVPM